MMEEKYGEENHRQDVVHKSRLRKLIIKKEAKVLPIRIIFINFAATRVKKSYPFIQI